MTATLPTTQTSSSDPGTSDPGTAGTRPGHPGGRPEAGGGSSPSLHRGAAAAAVVKAATYLVGLVVMGAYLVPEGFGDGGPRDAVDFLVEHQGLLYGWYLVLYLVGGAALVVLTLGIRQRLRAADALAQQAATAFGLIWSGLLLASGMIALVGQRAVVDLHAQDPEQAATVWSAVSAVQDGLGGGIELVGALWILLVSMAGLRTGVLPRGLHRLGLAIGAAGALTVVPGLEAAGAVFGLGMVVWFAGAGVALARPGAAEVAGARR